MANANVLQADAAEGSLLRRISDHLRNAWHGYWSNRAIRATALILRSLDDRTLKDIGMDRSEIKSIIYAHGASDRRVRMCPRSHQ